MFAWLLHELVLMISKVIVEKAERSDIPNIDKKKWAFFLTYILYSSVVLFFAIPLLNSEDFCKLIKVVRFDNSWGLHMWSTWQTFHLCAPSTRHILLLCESLLFYFFYFSIFLHFSAPSVFFSFSEPHRLLLVVAGRAWWSMIMCGCPCGAL